MPDTPITLDNLGLKTWDQLYALKPEEVIRKMSEKDVPIHPGDAFLAVLVLRGVADLVKATKRLDDGTTWLIRLTWALTALTVASVAIALIALLNT